MNFRALLFPAILLGAMLSGCHKEAAREIPKDAKVVTLWHGFTGEETTVFKQIMLDFEKDYEKRTGQKVIVDVQYVSYGDMVTKLRTAAMAKLTPDVAFMDSIKVTDMAFGRALVQMDSVDAFKKKYGTIAQGREEFVAASYDAGIVNRLGEEHLYGLPVQTTTIAMFWNREIFRQRADQLRKAGVDPNRPPKDWDELFVYGKALTDPQTKLYGFALSRSLWFQFPFFNMYEAPWVSYDAQGLVHSTIDSPNTRRALQRIQDIANSGVEGGAWRTGGLAPEPGFTNKRFAMIITGPWMVKDFTNAGMDFDIALVPAPSMKEVKELGLKPKLEGGDPADVSSFTSSNVGGQTGVILRNCKDRELAFEALDYFTSEPVQRQWASSLGQIPVRRSAWKDLDTSKFPFLPKFMAQLSSARRIPQIPLYGTLENDLYNPQIDLLLNNSQSADSMTQKMKASMDDKLFLRINEQAEATRKLESQEQP
ncbi:sugar ABC transporter substrate-binding protein [soil metagenome]